MKTHFVNGLVDVLSIVSPITDQRSNRTRHLIKQGTDPGAVINIRRGQLCRGDLAGLGVHTDVELAPGSARALVPCISISHFPDPQSYRPVLPASRCLVRLAIAVAGAPAASWPAGSGSWGPHGQIKAQ